MLEVIASIKDFDATHQNDDKFVDKAAVKCKALLYWLYLAGNIDNCIEKIPTQTCQNSTLASKFETLKHEILNLNSASSPLELISAPLSQLASSTRTTQEAISKLVDLQTKSSDKSTNSFKKIPGVDSEVKFWLLNL